MLFFGITNGRDCYCAPYYKKMESDSSPCDLPCEGKRSLMCGGKTKSSIFEMHECNDKPVVLAEAAVAAHSVVENIQDVVKDALKAADGKNKLAQTLQESLVQAGDPEAADLMQVAKVSAGNLEHLAEQTEAFANTMEDDVTEAKSMTGLSLQDMHDDAVDSDKPLTSILEKLVKPTVNFRKYENAYKADAMIKFLTETTPKANASLLKLQDALLASGPMAGGQMFLTHNIGGTCVVDKDGCFYTEPAKSFRWLSACSAKVEGEMKIKVTPFKRGSSPFQQISHSGPEGVLKYYMRNGKESDITAMDGKTISGGQVAAFALYPRGDLGWKICDVTPKGKSDRGKEYYSLMYFVDSKFANKPSTCSGTPVGQPIFDKNYQTCAAACDADTINCKGFFYYPKGRDSLCFMFSKFTSATYWTGCKSGSSFLQANQTAEGIYKPLGADDEPDYPICAAKLADYAGLDLTPDKSGKCKECLKKVKRADRCYE
eukprot:gnl/TRDRNA2_/TRDRNA2_174783_c2_seq5.p1 gnl/TRDRNA2_/TRDRNA2_174783_c2~~gnl/TRDRNA2_/TRDRNA2_174783_c2_seq5.p1  ORF type:complete len:487 (-),score=102.30 gnl/TRDRNA2_/TRDRNA2_174783_c2_seq5:243-1703(-)